MKTKLLLAFFCFYFVNTLKAQNPFPVFSDNPQWNVSRTTIGAPPSNYLFTYSQEINVCGKTYNKLIRNFSYNQGYIRNEGKKVYYRNSTNCNDPEYLVYDFSLAVGDTFSSITYAIDMVKIKYEVIDINPFVIENDTVMNFTMKFNLKLSWNSTELNGQLSFLEGIGCTRHPFYFTECFHYDGCENLMYLLCLHKNENLYASFLPGCFLGFVDVKENMVNADFNISPNPANDYFKIIVENFDDFKQTYFRLLDVSGKILWEKSFKEIENQNVSIQNLNNGLYFLQAVENGKILKAQKVLVQH